MDETDLLITQMGLLLTQTRFARRALEDIERATSNYATFAFTSVIAAGPRFGAPPMYDGALKVHVVNISDLAPGGGFGDFLGGLLGGVGNFLGSLPGGFIGSTLSSLQLVSAIPTIHALAGRIEHILAMLGIGAAPAQAPSTANERGGPVAGSNLVAQLESIRRAVDSLTGLFLAASDRPERAAVTSNLPSTPEGERWQRLLDSSSVVLNGIARVVNGLIIALPLAIGSIAWLIHRLGDIRLALAETLQFALRNTLLLRGTVAVLALDTVAMIARTAAAAISILAATLDGILSALFDTVREALLAVFELGAVLGDAIKNTADRLLNWLVPTVDIILRNLADLRAFRVLTHIIQVLPAVLPPVFELIKDRPMDPAQVTALEVASRRSILAPAVPGTGSGAGTPPPALDLRGVFTDPALISRATGALDRIQQVTTDGLRISSDQAAGGLRALGGQLDLAAQNEARLSDAKLGRLLGTVRTQSGALAANLIVPPATRQETGLERIATAYEGWLTGGGLNTLLSSIDKHFATAPAASGLSRRIVEGTMDPPRATVQIDEVIIDVAAPAPEQPPATTPSWGPGDYPVPSVDDDAERWARWRFDFDQRGGRGRQPTLLG